MELGRKGGPAVLSELPLAGRADARTILTLRNQGHARGVQGMPKASGGAASHRLAVLLVAAPLRRVHLRLKPL